MIRFSKRNKALVQITCSSRELDTIRNFFTTEDPRDRYARYNKSVCPISALGNFATMLLFDIYSGVRQLFPADQIVVDPELIPAIRSELPGCHMVQPLNPEFIPRPHQIKSVQAFFKLGHGLIVQPTRAGKSLILYLIVRSLFETCQKPFNTALLLVPNTQLVIQMWKDMVEKYQVPDTMDVVQYSSATPELPPQRKKRLIVSNRQWLEKHYLELPKQIDLLIVDEVHFCKIGNWITEFVEMFETRYKLGCTGTLPDSMKDVWKVKKLFGPIIYEEKTTTLQEAGLLSKIDITPIRFNHRYRPRFHFDEEEGVSIYSKECDYLANHTEMNTIIAKIISSLKGNVVMLFDNLAYGKMLFDLSTGNKHYVDGSVKMNVRENIREMMSKTLGNILFANSSCMGTGVTIDMVDAIVLAGMSRSSSTSVIQAIGRGLAIYEGKKALQLLDFSANLTYSEKHQLLRFLLYQRFYGMPVDDLHKKTKTVSI